MLRDEIFPMSSSVNAAGHLEIGGCDLVALAAEYGTPLYVFDESTLREQALAARSAFESRWPETTVLYATKAYFSPFLARLYRDLGLGIDVTSEGELEIARRVDFPRDRIYLHGNNKSATEVGFALDLGVEHIVVDNRTEIPVIASLAAEKSRRVRLLLRLSPDIDPHTHRHLTTGHAESKFGLGVSSSEALRAAEEISTLPKLDLVGLHMHLGSQYFEVEPLLHGLDCALKVAADWRERFGFRLKELDLGGGWGIAYTGEQDSLSVSDVAQKVCRALEQGLAEKGLERCRLLVEPGRALVGRAAVALYRVGSIKQVSPERTFAAVDGGIGDNIRPALYGARYTAAVANRYTEPPEHSYSIAGRYCEQGDVLIDSVRLPKLETGDLLALPGAGAYQLPMSSNYNLIPRPAVVLVSYGQARLLRRRETLADLLNCDVE